MMSGGAAAAVCFRRRDRGGTVVGIALPLCKRRTRILPLAPSTGRGWVRGLRVLVSSRVVAHEAQRPSPCPSPTATRLPPAHGARGSCPIGLTLHCSPERRRRFGVWPSW